MQKKTEEILIFEKKDTLATLWLNRPQQKNALSLELALRLSQVLKEVAADPEIRVVVLRGKGRCFSAGGDLKFFHQNLDQAQQNFLKISKILDNCVQSIINMPKPILAAIEGPAYAAGFGLALSCDLIVASETARLSPSFVNIALSANASSTHFLPRILGEKKAREAFLMGKAWSAKEAFNLGIVSEVFSEEGFEEGLEKLIKRLKQSPTATLARLKKVLNLTWENPLAQQLELERQQIAASATSEDFKEGVRAFVEKRRPKFIGK